MKTKSKDIIMQDKVFGYLAVITAGILSIPLVAMQFSSEWDWNLFDFVVIGSLLFGAGTMFVYVARITSKKYRTVIAIGFVLAVLLVWAELAVGIFGSPFAGS